MSLWRKRRRARGGPAKASGDVWSETRKNVEEKLGIDLNAVVQQAAKGAAEKAVEMAVFAVMAKMGNQK